MSDSLACPECGNIEFEQNNLVKFDLAGDVVDEEQGTYCCNSCGWELSDEAGSPITDSEEIVQKFFLSSKTIVLALSIASSSLEPGYVEDDWELTPDEYDEWCSIANDYLSHKLSAMFGGLSVEFTEDCFLGERAAANPSEKPIVTINEDEWYDRYNALYCDAAFEAYEDIVAAMNTSDD